ncbi:succinate dehydrogenase assembly factor 2 [bacterium]|nr:succinate dehydrogenase assembly factor 2 [bacterium]
MKEHDVLLERFLASPAGYDMLEPEQQQAFLRFIELDDPTMNAVFCGREAAPDDGVAEISRRLVEFRPE